MPAFNIVAQKTTHHKSEFGWPDTQTTQQIPAFIVHGADFHDAQMKAFGILVNTTMKNVEIHVDFVNLDTMESKTEEYIF